MPPGLVREERSIRRFAIDEEPEGFGDTDRAQKYLRTKSRFRVGNIEFKRIDIEKSEKELAIRSCCRCPSAATIELQFD